MPARMQKSINRILLEAIQTLKETILSKGISLYRKLYIYFQNIIKKAFFKRVQDKLRP